MDLGSVPQIVSMQRIIFGVDAIDVYVQVEIPIGVEFLKLSNIPLGSIRKSE